MDQRDQYLNQLSDLTGARTVNRENGTVDVLIGNAVVVTGDFSHELTVDYKMANGTPGGNPQLRNGDQLVVTVNGQSATPVAGSLKATVDGANTTLKKQWDNLDTFTQGFTAAVNTAYDVAGAGKFFTPAAGDTTISAHSVQVRTDLVASPATLVDSAAGTSDRAVAQSVLKTFDATKAAWRTNATNIAASTQSAANRADLASQVSLKSGAVRDGVSGVNLDEEMTNLVAYQHAYSAAAKVLTTMDEALDTLLNMVR
jgi:flagellar hook-associated protein 1 FlgK